MVTINNIKKRAAEIKNAYEPESVTAEKVGKLFEDIADVTEQAITSSEEVMQESVRASEQASQAAEDASGYLADLQEAIENLPDGQAVSAQVAVNQTDITGLKSKTDFISKQSTESEEQALVFETNGGTQVGKIDANGADFANLKRGGQQVARMSDLPTKDSSIGENPSTTNVPTTKAVKDYVDEHGTVNLPISEETTQSEDEETVFSDDAGTDIYAKIGSYGVKAKAYYDLNGNPIGSDSQLGGKKIMIFGGSVSALFDSYGGTDIVEDALGVTMYDMGVHGAGFITNIAINNNAIEYSGVNIQKTVEENTQQNSTVCDVYIFWASTNDYYRIMNDTSLIGNPEDFTAKDSFNIQKRLNQCGGLNYCIKKIQNFNPSAKIIVFGSLKAFKGEDTHYIEDRESLSGKFKQMVDGQEQCALRMSLPFYSLWANSGINEYNCEYYMYHDENDTFYGSPAHGNDGIHPNAIAYNMLAHKIISFLKTI